MRLWPKAWFHNHRWRKLIPITPIRPSELHESAVSRIGVECRESWCRKRKWIAPLGSYNHSFYSSKVKSWKEAKLLLEAAFFEEAQP